eukprot:Sdes_comp18503_c0_seq3m8532
MIPAEKIVQVCQLEESLILGEIFVPVSTSLKKAREYISVLENVPEAYKFVVDGVVISPKQESKIKCASFEKIQLQQNSPHHPPPRTRASLSEANSKRKVSSTSTSSSFISCKQTSLPRPQRHVSCCQ